MLMINIISISIVLLIVIFVILIYTLTGSNKISSEEAKKMIQNGDIRFVIDVRTNMEWDIGHYKNALHIPVQEITEENINKYNISKDSGILVYCNTGQRARFAADMIKKYGYSRVYYITTTYKSLE